MVGVAGRAALFSFSSREPPFRFPPSTCPTQSPDIVAIAIGATAEDGRAGDQDIGARSNRSGGGLLIDATVDLERDRAATFFDHDHRAKAQGRG